MKARYVRGVREGCGRDAGHEDIGSSILVRFEASKVVYAIDEVET